jgi:hypothetical protein
MRSLAFPGHMSGICAHRYHIALVSVVVAFSTGSAFLLLAAL